MLREWSRVGLTAANLSAWPEAPENRKRRTEKRETRYNTRSIARRGPRTSKRDLARWVRVIVGWKCELICRVEGRKWSCCPKKKWIDSRTKSKSGFSRQCPAHSPPQIYGLRPEFPFTATSHDSLLSLFLSLFLSFISFSLSLVVVVPHIFSFFCSLIRTLFFFFNNTI